MAASWHPILASPSSPGDHGCHVGPWALQWNPWRHILAVKVVSWDHWLKQLLPWVCHGVLESPMDHTLGTKLGTSLESPLIWLQLGGFPGFGHSWVLWQNGLLGFTGVIGGCLWVHWLCHGCWFLLPLWASVGVHMNMFMSCC